MTDDVASPFKDFQGSILRKPSPSSEWRLQICPKTDWKPIVYRKMTLPMEDEEALNIESKHTRQVRAPSKVQLVPTLLPKVLYKAEA